MNPFYSCLIQSFMWSWSLRAGALCAIQKDDRPLVGDYVFLVLLVDQFYCPCINCDGESFKMNHFFRKYQKRFNNGSFKYFEKLRQNTIFSRRLFGLQEINGFREFLNHEILVQPLRLLGQDNFGPTLFHHIRRSPLTIISQ